MASDPGPGYVWQERALMDSDPDLGYVIEGKRRQ